MRIVVVGGGVVGLSVAVRLARGGHRVTVLDSARGDEAPSWNNAGHLAVEQVAPLASRATLRTMPRRLFVAGGALGLPPSQLAAWLPFGLRMLAASGPARFAAGLHALGALLRAAMPAWHRLVADLGEADLVAAAGHLMCWESAAAAERGRAALAATDIGTASVHDATDGDRALLRALTGRPVEVARLDGTGQVRDLGRLARALRSTLVAAGGSVVAEAARVGRRGDAAVVADHPADVVVIAAGVASGAIMRGLGHRAPVIAERGYHLRAAAGDWPSDAPPIVFDDRSIILTRYADRVQTSSFVEFAAPDAPADPRKWRRLERHVAELGLPMRPPFTRWMGARPTLPDYLPAIGRSRSIGNLLYAFGHQHLGLTLAPVTAEAIAALVEGRGAEVDLAPFDLARFGAGRGR